TAEARRLQGAADHAGLTASGSGLRAPPPPVAGLVKLLHRGDRGGPRRASPGHRIHRRGAEDAGNCSFHDAVSPHPFPVGVLGAGWGTISSPSLRPLRPLRPLRLCGECGSGFSAALRVLRGEFVKPQSAQGATTSSMWFPPPHSGRCIRGGVGHNLLPFSASPPPLRCMQLSAALRVLRGEFPVPSVSSAVNSFTVRETE